MHYEWDESKNKNNLAKPGVGFETAQLVFDDPYALSIQDRHEEGEERWQTLGLVGGVIVLLVAHTCIMVEHVEVIRLISARKATKREKERYEQNH